MSEALVAGVIMMAATLVMNEVMAPKPPDTSKAVQLGDQGTPIDKSQAQKEADVGKLQLGEDDKKNKRKKGKDAFKIELDKQKKAEGADANAKTGVQVAKTQDTKPKTTGVQL